MTSQLCPCHVDFELSIAILVYFVIVGILNSGYFAFVLHLS